MDRFEFKEEYFQRIEKAPSLNRFNGVGTIMWGGLVFPIIPNAYVAIRWFTIFFIPVIPLSGYVVTGSFPSGPLNFHGKIGIVNLFKIYGSDARRLLISSFFKTLLYGFLLVVGGVGILYLISLIL